MLRAPCGRVPHLSLDLTDNTELATDGPSLCLRVRGRTINFVPQSHEISRSLQHKFPMP